MWILSHQDHHCHVTGTCIGLGNHRYFMQFLIYLWLAGACHHPDSYSPNPHLHPHPNVCHLSALLHLIYIVSKSLFTSAPLPDDSVLSGALLLYCSVADLAAVILPSFLLFSQMAMIRVRSQTFAQLICMLTETRIYWRL